MLRNTLLASALIAATAAPVFADGHVPGTANATINGLDGRTIGSASFQALPSGQVLVTISATDLAPGWHGVHIHETGACDAANGFSSAGGHLAGDAQHGLMVEGGPHPGDLPNQMVRPDGTLTAEIVAPDALKLTGDGNAIVLDADGSALMIHSGRDDYKSQPGGNAGDRIACGVIEAAK